MGDRTEEIEQISWFEDLDRERVALMAERLRGGAWEFWEKRASDIRHHPIPSTVDLVTKVMSLRRPNR